MVIVVSFSFIKKYRYIIVFLCLLLVFAVWLFLFRKRIFFKVSNYNETIDVGSHYVYPDVSACYGNVFSCKKIDYVMSDNINDDVIGKYTVIYDSSYGKKKARLRMDVNVVDRVAPVIVSDDLIYACPNTTNFNIDYSVIDNYDGDLSGQVSEELDGDNLILKVYDSSLNFSSKTVKIVYEDKIIPFISLNGDSNIYVKVNSLFEDPFVTAFDNCDGDIKDKVKVSGNVDTSKPGVYFLNYEVSDTSLNINSISRVVNVYNNNNSGSKVVYLTFDDGPSAYTGQLLDILANYDVKATFFVTGRNSQYDGFITRAFKEGHSIGLHTNSHNYSLIYSSVSAYFDDLNSISNKVKSLTGMDSKLIRFPGGSSNTVSKITPGIMSELTSEVERRGYHYFDWNISSGDASGGMLDSNTYANNVINALGDGSGYIVLQHDINYNSVLAVRMIIEYGLSHGYRFEPLVESSPTAHHRIFN